MYTGVIDQNLIRNFFRPIGYPIFPPLKLYEDKQATINEVVANIIAPQAIPLDILITALHELHLQKIF